MARARVILCDRHRIEHSILLEALQETTTPEDLVDAAAPLHELTREIDACCDCRSQGDDFN